MKRFAISILFGLLLPVLYTIVAVSLTGIYPEYFTQSIKMFGESVPGPILAPTLFPFYFDTWLSVNYYFGWGWLLDNRWVRLITWIVPTIAIYSIVSYGVLRLIGFPRSKATEGIHEPPPPNLPSI